MRIYSDKITRADVETAFHAARVENGADIWIDDIRPFHPRRGYSNGTEFWAYSRHGTMRSAHNSGRLRAASWTDYGYVIAHLFNVDSHARIGQYNGEADFVAQVRQHPRTDRGNSTAFLAALTNVGRYPPTVMPTPPCEVCGGALERTETAGEYVHRDSEPGHTPHIAGRRTLDRIREGLNQAAGQTWMT